MKPVFWKYLIASAVILVLAGCSSGSGATPIPNITLDNGNTSSTNRVKASGVVVPARETHLSFVLSGVIENVTVVEGEQVQAGQALAKLDTSELEYDVISAEAAISVAEFDAKISRLRDKQFNVLTGKIIYVSPPGEQILAANSRLEQSRLALEVAKATLDQGILLAPFDATVVTVNVMPGEYVQASQVVLELADLNNLQIETTDLSELNVPSVKVGQPATVFVEALNEEFPGKVITISPISSTIGGDIVFRVTVELDEQPAALLWGMSTDVEIDTQ